jgi:hypothetical protein
MLPKVMEGVKFTGGIGAVRQMPEPLPLDTASRRSLRD